MSAVPARPRIYHIVHIDRLPSIVCDGFLWCDSEVLERAPDGTMIGMSSIKQRRLDELTLASHPDLHVGECVPFYFCPRSVMLYVIYQRNHPELEYHGGQEPIVHLEADLHASIAWAIESDRRWAFTLTNAGSYFFEDRADLAALGEIEWAAIRAGDWRSCKEGKQAEFLMEHSFPWELIERIGVFSEREYRLVLNATQSAAHRPVVEVKRDWYY